MGPGLLLAMLVALLIAIVLRTIAIGRQRRKTRTEGIEENLAVTSPSFRVVALGVAGSGKTVFLAGMFHRLHVQSPGGSYFLEADAAHRVALSRVFRQVTNSDEPWPPGTSVGETREFTFDCMAHHEGAKHKVLSINYLDYAGELLETEQEGGSGALAELEGRINEAHALLAMIDGYRVLQYLRNEPDGHAYVRSAIQPMIGFMASATCPIHFVLTKWDLVRGFGEHGDVDDDTRLRIVREALIDGLQIEPLVTRQGKASRIVRLIPVSVVGDDFVRLDERGNVVKRPDGWLRPTNLEVPLSAVLPDLFRQAEASLEDSVRREINAMVRSRSRLSPRESVALAAKLLSAPAGVLLRGTLRLGVGRAYGDEVVTMFLDWMGRPFEDKHVAVEKARTEGERQANLTRQLRDQVLKEFDTAVLRLEAHLSASRLSG